MKLRSGNDMNIFGIEHIMRKKDDQIVALKYQLEASEARVQFKNESIYS